MAIPTGDIFDMAKIFLFSMINFPKPIKMKKYPWLVSLEATCDILIYFQIYFFTNIAGNTYKT